MFDVCLVTSGHLATNPRLVKEMEALRDAGYSVAVVACRFIDWADEADADIDCKKVMVEKVAFGPKAGVWKQTWQRILHHAAKKIARFTPKQFSPNVYSTALHPAFWDLKREILRFRARLYIAHNLPALPVAFYAAKKFGSRLGFDAEDFHGGEFDFLGLDRNPIYQITRWVEQAFIPKCDYVTAASDGISARYASWLNIEQPETILNVFPTSDRSLKLSEDERKSESADGTVSLYWFSQTIGPNRGLEVALAALRQLPENHVLSLRGQWARGYRDSFFGVARSFGLAHRVRELAPASPNEMIARAACHDIGLALEVPHCENRDLCVTNKLFTYLSAGIPCLLTNTLGQGPFASKLPDAVKKFDGKDPSEAAACILELTNNLEAARPAALTAGSAYSWDNESRRFLKIVRAQIGQPVTIESSN